MSAALVRQALEFVDKEEGVEKRDKRRAGRKGSSSGQDRGKPYKRPAKEKHPPLQSQAVAKATIKKLLALSRPATDKRTAQKIVQRAIKGKPLIEKPEVKKEEPRSILFADEDEAQPAAAH